MSTKTQCRNWLGTYNNPKVDPEEYVRAWKGKFDCLYVNGQYERGKEGTPHIQFYLSFKTNKRLAALKKVCQYSHFEPCHYSGGAERYCLKEDTRIDGPWQEGVMPARLNVKGDKKLTNMQMLEIGAEKCVEENHCTWEKYPKVKSAMDLYKNCTSRPECLAEEDLQKLNEWVYGRPGVGKTRYVIETYPDYYDKDKTKYWNGYTNQEVVLVDDIEEDEKFMLGNLKKWVQNKPFPAEDKFGQMRQIRPKKFIVTSNYHPNEIWSKPKELEAVLRRFKVHHIIGGL